MTPIEIALSLVALAIQAAPQVMSMIQDLKKDNVTLEDIRALQARIQRPENYFERGEQP